MGLSFTTILSPLSSNTDQQYQCPALHLLLKDIYGFKKLNLIIIRNNESVERWENLRRRARLLIFVLLFSSLTASRWEPTSPTATINKLTKVRTSRQSSPLEYGHLCEGIDLRCYPETEKVLLEQLWGNSCNRAVIYCLTVITFYFLLLGGIIVYETYQVSPAERTNQSNPWNMNLFWSQYSLYKGQFVIGKNCGVGRLRVQPRISNIQSFVSYFLSAPKYFHYHISTFISRMNWDWGDN